MKPPERLGKYRITEVLGEGSMGVVYKGFDPDIRRTVALKTIRASFGERAVQGVAPADRFRNEAQAAGRLMHPGIVAVYDYGHDGDIAFIAMEFVEGHTLGHYLSHAAASGVTIADDDILSITGQLLEALHHAHEQGVWHRDIKPANLIMTRGGKLKISDFGIARIESAGLTQATSMIGTPTYMAPEQFLGHDIDRRVDIYSVGVVLYQLLTGKPPFSGPPETVMYKAVHEQPLPPSQALGAERPAAYDAVVARALAKEPAQRYASAAEFRAALVDAVGRVHNDAVSEATIVMLPPRSARAADAAPSGGAAPGSTSGSTSGGASRGHGTGGVSGGDISTGQPPTHWDAALLAKAEATLARHVGPLAAVLVRRAARECRDLPALYSRLAEQLTNPAARSAFLSQLPATQSGSTAGGSSAAAAPPISSGTAAGAAPPSPALVDAAVRLLAQQVGPIAKVLVRRASAECPQRDAFIARLATAVTDPAARRALIAALAKLA